jgi:ATP-dependent RNA helicase DDX18/HAS1
MEVAGAQARAAPLMLRRPASLRTSVSTSRRSWAAAAAVAEGGGYDKVPMDTPGAYRLVDRATGRSVIVWGGTDQGDEVAVPSPAVLSRTTDRPSRGYSSIPPRGSCFALLAAGSVRQQLTNTAPRLVHSIPSF